MATTATLDQVRSGQAVLGAGLARSARLVAHAALPVGAFGFVNFLAIAFGHEPIFFAPFGLPHWAGAMAHLAQLGLLGAAFWALSERPGHAAARNWLIGLTGLYIALPFLTPLLDALQLTLACTALFLVALATMVRLGAVSRLASFMVAPMLVIVGLSAALGLALAAAYTPPFALTQTGQAQAGA